METRALDLTLTLREDDPTPDVAATLDGVAVPYNTPTPIGPGVREQFAPAAFDVNDVIGKPLAWRHGEPIGRITHATNTPDGLAVTAQIADTALGRDAATLLRTGAVTGLSVGFIPVTNARSKTGDLITRVKAQLRELSLTHIPAYTTAVVGAVREEESMPETDVVETPVSAPDLSQFATRDDVAALERQIAATVHVTETVEHPLAKYRSLGEYSKAVYEGLEDRAAPDQITDDNPGVIPPNWLNDVKNIVSHGRPAVTALGVQSAGASGMDIDWPYYDGDISAIVAAQATEKTALNTALISIKKGTAALATYGAYSDISYQLLMRSSPSYLDAHNRIMLNSYALITDNVFADALVSGGTASAFDYDLAADTTGLEFREGVFYASVEVETATGQPASVVLVATDVFTKMGGWSDLVPQPYGTSNIGGTATAASLSVNVSGLPVVHDRNLPAGAIVVTNSTAAKWVEDGPRFATAEVVSKLGRDVAVWGMGVTAIFNSKGVRKLTNLP